MDRSLEPAYFERLYADSDDPWNFETSPYEREKYLRTVEMLGGPYESGLEIGCSIGVLTKRLARHFKQLLAVDVSERALERARERCAGLPVSFARAVIPEEFPAGRFEAVVVSEVGYYWSDADLALAAGKIAASAAGGILELVHFLPKVADYVRDGDAVHEFFLRDGRFAPMRRFRTASYRIDVLGVR